MPFEGKITTECKGVGLCPCNKQLCRYKYCTLCDPSSLNILYLQCIPEISLFRVHPCFKDDGIEVMHWVISVVSAMMHTEILHPS